MAYVSKDKKAAIDAAIKTVLAAHPWARIRYSLAVRNHSTVILTVRAGNVFGRVQGCYGINPYWIHRDAPAFGDGSAVFTEREHKLICALVDALNTGNYDRSDIMSDYHDVGHYVDLSVGTWDKPYILRP